MLTDIIAKYDQLSPFFFFVTMNFIFRVERHLTQWKEYELPIKVNLGLNLGLNTVAG